MDLGELLKMLALSVQQTGGRGMVSPQYNIGQQPAPQVHLNPQNFDGTPGYSGGVALPGGGFANGSYQAREGAAPNYSLMGGYRKAF